MNEDDSHHILIGYILWIFGFMGAHRFYFGKPISGTVYFLTLGLLGIGWIVDLVLIPGLANDANFSFERGPTDYTVAWILLTFLGLFGIHRFYMQKYGTGIIYLLTGGIFTLGIIYDFWTLNDQINDQNIGQRRIQGL